jgi:uncharacterized protein YneF (UPF0154 family)
VGVEMTALALILITLALLAGLWIGSAITIWLGDWLSDRRRLL